MSFWTVQTSGYGSPHMGMVGSGLSFTEGRESSMDPQITASLGHGPHCRNPGDSQSRTAWDPQSSILPENTTAAGHTSKEVGSGLVTWLLFNIDFNSRMNLSMLRSVPQRQENPTHAANERLAMTRMG